MLTPENDFTEHDALIAIDDVTVDRRRGGDENHDPTAFGPTAIDIFRLSAEQVDRPVLEAGRTGIDIGMIFRGPANWPAGAVPSRPGAPSSASPSSTAMEAGSSEPSSTTMAQSGRIVGERRFDCFTDERSLIAAGDHHRDGRGRGGLRMLLPITAIPTSEARVEWKREISSDRQDQP